MTSQLDSDAIPTGPVRKFRNASVGTGEIAISQAGREEWGRLMVRFVLNSSVQITCTSQRVVQFFFLPPVLITLQVFITCYQVESANILCEYIQVVQVKYTVLVTGK